jgi:uncharacterized membrane protein (DUF441 family)
MEQQVEMGIMLSHVANYTPFMARGKIKLSQLANFLSFAFSRQVIFGLA